MATKKKNMEVTVDVTASRTVHRKIHVPANVAMSIVAAYMTDAAKAAGHNFLVRPEDVEVEIGDVDLDSDVGRLVGFTYEADVVEMAVK